MRGVALQANETSIAEGLEGLLPFEITDQTVQIALALLVLLAGWYLSKVAVRITGRTIARRIERPSVTRTVLRGVRVIVLVFTLFTVAGILGFTGVEVLLPATIFSAVVGVVLAPLIGSFVNGLFVLADRPYEIGDMIEVADAGHRGFVEDITIRYTKIFTLDNTFIVIPNSEIHTRDVVNYSAEDERTRLSIQYAITYESDLAQARQLAERAARNVDDVISGGPDIRIGSARYPSAPTCFVDEYGDDGILLRLRYWAKHPYKLLSVRSQIQDQIWSRYEDADVEIAYPHRHHVFDETSGAARVAFDDGKSARVAAGATDAPGTTDSTESAGSRGSVEASETGPTDAAGSSGPSEGSTGSE